MLVYLQQGLHKFPFLFLHGSYSGLIYLKMAASAAAYLTLWYTSSLSAFSRNVMTLLLGSTSSISSGTSHGCHGVIWGLWYCTKCNENTREPWEITFYCATYPVYCKTAVHTEMISITWHIKQILVILELFAVATGGDCEIITVAQYILPLILCSLDLMLHLPAAWHYVCLCVSFENF